MLPLLQIKNCTVTFPGTDSALPALENFSMDLNRGELLAVVGESGSGKSVMSLMLMGLLSKTAEIREGSILYSADGLSAIDLLSLPEPAMAAYRGNQLAMIFQEPMTSLNPLMTCGRQIMEPLMQHEKMSRQQAKQATLALLEKVKLPDPLRVFEKYPHQLSGGQKQRVMIAMAISCKPDVLICDEPTTALDVRVQKTILDLLKDLRTTENMGMIFITHDLGLVADMADRAVVMLKGKIVEQGPVKKIFSHPSHPYTKGLLLCRPALHAKGERLPVVSDFLKDPAALETPVAPSKERPVLPKGETEIFMQIRGLHLQYSSGKNWMGKEKKWVDAIRDIDFDIYRGETLGIVGESGSGKSTLGRALLGLNKPGAGSIFYEGRDLLKMRKSERLSFRRNIQIVFQDPYSSLNPRLKVGSAISEPFAVHTSLNKTERRDQVLDWLERVGLQPEHADRYPHAFSGGQRQRIVIARALAMGPGFVVFDESVSALDVSVQAQVLNLIGDLKRTLGFTAVFISHDLSVVRYLCDRILVMEKGFIVESGDAEELYRNPRTEYTRALIAAIPGGKFGKLEN